MKRIRKLVRKSLGYFLVVLGILGLILPILPGWIFLVPGIYLIGTESKLGKWVHERTPPSVRKWFDKFADFLTDPDEKEKNRSQSKK